MTDIPAGAVGREHLSYEVRASLASNANRGYLNQRNLARLVDSLREAGLIDEFELLGPDARDTGRNE